MAAKESQEMREVRKLVLTGEYTVYAAVAKVGNLTTSAVYMSGWYKEWRDGQAKPITLRARGLRAKLWRAKQKDTATI